MKCRLRSSAQLKDAYPQSRLARSATRLRLGGNSQAGSEDGEDVHSKAGPEDHETTDYETMRLLNRAETEGVKLQSGCRVLFELGQEIPQASRNDFRRTDAAKKVKSGPATLFVVVWRLTEDS